MLRAMSWLRTVMRRIISAARNVIALAIVAFASSMSDVATTKATAVSGGARSTRYATL
jgi:hypothetical protein